MAFFGILRLSRVLRDFVLLLAFFEPRWGDFVILYKSFRFDANFSTGWGSFMCDISDECS